MTKKLLQVKRDEILPWKTTFELKIQILIRSEIHLEYLSLMETPHWQKSIISNMVFDTFPLFKQFDLVEEWYNGIITQVSNPFSPRKYQGTWNELQIWWHKSLDPFHHRRCAQHCKGCVIYLIMLIALMMELEEIWGLKWAS